MPIETNRADFLDFISFIKKFYPYYLIDQFNRGILEQISLYAAQDERFEKKSGQYLHKGIWLIGPYGTGKTDLFYLLGKYLGPYLNTRYSFTAERVWKFTNEYSKNGYEALDGQEKGNKYYDELCLINERTGHPDKEEAVHYGKKILVGEEIISLRYESFKSYGYVTHFSSNAPEEDVERVYGGRPYDRLREMCNIFILAGDSRRGGAGHSFENKNQSKPPMPREVNADYHTENILVLERHYIDFIEAKDPSTNMALVYNMLVAYGVKVAEDEELLQLMEDVKSRYAPEQSGVRMNLSERETRKKEYIWEQSRKAAVGIFFQKMKNAGTKSIFGVRNVDDKDLPALGS